MCKECGISWKKIAKDLLVIVLVGKQHNNYDTDDFVNIPNLQTLNCGILGWSSKSCRALHSMERTEGVLEECQTRLCHTISILSLISELERKIKKMSAFVHTTGVSAQARRYRSRREHTSHLV